MSNTQLKELRKNIEDLILSEEQVASDQYPANEVYDIKFANGEVVGPIWQQDIREYVHSSGHIEDGTQVKAHDQEEWGHIFEHPLFQRRKPQLVSTQVLDNEEVNYHLLIDGQKHGPYTAFEVNSMIETKEILVTDEVSIDNGTSWGQLYEIEDFDRRVLKSNEELPHLPKKDIFKKSANTAGSKLENFSDEKTNLIAGLAYIGNLRAGKAKEALRKTNFEESESSEDIESHSEKTDVLDYLWKGLFVISAIGLVAIFITWSNHKATNEKAPSSTSSTRPKRIEPIKLKPVKTFDSKGTPAETTSIDTESKVNSRPTSFRRSKAFRQGTTKKKKKKLTDDARYPAENDDFYYDDNTAPVELDPIRNTLSKEIIDPEFDDAAYVDEQEGDFSAKEEGYEEEIFNEEVEY